MKLEITTKYGCQIHSLNDYQFKQFKEWIENPNSRNIFTYLKDGYAWSLAKPSVEIIKYIR
ncbi:hypothetical protein [Clostridium rectalis]|uniref:hypothetical protein n=1 Tax=Clostridium rectalis TaxID=2040295 RepID=UPI000F636B14|nr:hypothetical protein [Clostridium rectalis]